jgi:hypothetical protein
MLSQTLQEFSFAEPHARESWHAFAPVGVETDSVKRRLMGHWDELSPVQVCEIARVLDSDQRGSSEFARACRLQGAMRMVTAGYAAFGMLCSLYLLKSMLHIDLFAGPSPLHPLFEAFLG